MSSLREREGSPSFFSDEVHSQAAVGEDDAAEDHHHLPLNETLCDEGSLSNTVVSVEERRSVVSLPYWNTVRSSYSLHDFSLASRSADPAVSMTTTSNHHHNNKHNNPSNSNSIRFSFRRPRPPAFTFTEDLSDHTTTADFTNVSSEVHSNASSASANGGQPSAFRHRSPGDRVRTSPSSDRVGGGGDGGGGGAEVSSFRYCIQPTPENYTGGPPPRRTGPCSADLLRRVILFVDASARSDILEMGRVCRFWRYHTNFAPHWTAFRKKDWSTRALNIPKNVRTTVVKQKTVTREEYVSERKLLTSYQRQDRIVSRARYIRWCAALGIVAAILLSANYVIAFCMGFFRTQALGNDTTLGVATFFLMLILSLCEAALVLFPLGGTGEAFTESNRVGRMSRVLCWTELLVALSLVFGIILALSFSRVSGLSSVLNGPLLNMTMNAACEYVAMQMTVPSFVTLPAPLSDIRWRPLTMDPTEKEHVPYCLDTVCYDLLYFDSAYQSPAFQNQEGYDQRNIGTYLALGYAVFKGCGSDVVSRSTTPTAMNIFPSMADFTRQTTVMMLPKDRSSHDGLHRIHYSRTGRCRHRHGIDEEGTCCSGDGLPSWDNSDATRRVQVGDELQRPDEGSTPSGRCTDQPASVVDGDGVWEDDTDTDTNNSSTGTTTTSCSPWCAGTEDRGPQIIAVSRALYELLLADLGNAFPSAAAWLNVENLPHNYTNITYRVSSNARHSITEMTPGASSLWWENPLWQNNFIPLLSNVEDGPASLQQRKEHFVWYGYACIICTSIIWGLMIMVQCIFKSAAMGLLGVSTCVTFIFLNPISMIIAGGLCVNTSEYYTMCSPAAGGGLVGGGLSLLFVVLTIYFSL